MFLFGSNTAVTVIHDHEEEFVTDALKLVGKIYIYSGFKESNLKLCDSSVNNGFPFFSFC